MRGGDRDPIFLIGLGDEHESLAGRVRSLGYRPIRADDPTAAAMFLARLDRPVRAAIIPAGDRFLDRARELAQLSGACGGLRYVVTGKPPEPDAIDELRRDGVRFCLWAPFSDSELRFVVNRALYDPTRGEVRDRTRVPTELLARVRKGERERQAGVYNLSCVGAYLETQRSALKGGRLTVALPLPAGEIQLQALVALSNVPGNLMRGNLPMGMGVEFLDVDAASQAALEQFVSQRAQSCEL